MKKLTRIAMDRFLAVQATNERTLEIGVPGGAGYGHFFPNHTTFDIDPRRKPDVVGDVYKLPFADGSWPVVVMIEVLEHLEEPARALAEAQRVLIPGGTLILTTRFIQVVHDAPGDYFRFTYYGLKYLLREWREVEIQADLTSMETFAALFQRLIYQTDVRGGKITKGFFLLSVHVFMHLRWLITKEYGNIQKSALLEGGLLASGYHVVAHKPAA